MAFRLSCPQTFSDENVLRFLQVLESATLTPDAYIDFKPIRFVYPFPTLASALGVRKFVRERKRLGLRTLPIGSDSKDAAISYLRYIGFFKFIGVDSGNNPGRAPGSSRYLPITVLKRSELLSQKIRNESIQDVIDSQSDRLARVLFPEPENEGPSIMLSYCFRELIRNVFEHAEVDTCIAMAQRWQNGEAEIAIADEGIGFLSSLRKSYMVESPDEAIRLAMLPGYSSGLTRATGSRWDNSGYGLYDLAPDFRTPG
ncbi:MAG: ATP-binding protein [Pseudomonadota bacterium]